MGNMGNKRIYDEIDDTKKTIVKPVDDEAEEEAKVENLDEPEPAAEDKKEVDMDSLLGGDDEEPAEDEDPGEDWENLDIPEDIEPVEMPEKPEIEATVDKEGGISEVTMNMNREREWIKLGALHGYVDHKGKYHAPDPEMY